MDLSKLPVVRLKPKRDKKIRSAYPWVQREEVRHAQPCEAGGIARLISHESEFLAVGTYNGESRFPFRVLSLHEEPIDQAFFERRLKACLARRDGLVSGTNAQRVVFSEADQLPGLIVDQYADVLVVQVRSKGMDVLKPLWLPALIAVFNPVCIFEKSEMEGRSEEGLGPYAGLLHGEMPESVVIDEHGLKFEVPVIEGLKTGYYLDQRDTRRRLAERVKPGDSVLDAFCYSGGFSLYAGRAGAKTLGVDISELAIDTARRNAALNGLESQCAFELTNAFEYLESRSKDEPKFDWMVLDPPAIAKQRDKRSSLKWGVWNLVYHGVEHLKPGGRMVVCTCSYQLSLHETIETVRLAASDKGYLAYLEEVTIQSPDHPHLIQFPESLYLKCAWVRFEKA